MKPKGTDYSQVDWSKSNSEIAKELGIVTKTVYKARIRRGIPPAHQGEGKGNRNPTNKPWLYSSKNKPITDLDYEFSTPKKPWRAAVKQCYGEACQICGYHRPPISNHCHHRIAKEDGGRHTIRNASVLCSRCHDEVHAGFLELPDLENS